MHFYEQTKDGIKPCHFVPMSKDPTRTRPSRVTDAKKAAKEGRVWYASVTSVLNILDKPALVNWKVDQHLQTVYEYLLHEGVQSDYDSFARVMKAKTQERLDLAPQAGTDIHKVLEDFAIYNIMPDDPTERVICANVADAILNKTGGTLAEFHCEKYFINKAHGYAGCADLYSSGWVIDYKSKKEASKFHPGKMAYPEHSRQLAAYGNALCDENFKAANIFICLGTGEVDFHEHKPEAIEIGWLDFLDCLSIYKRNTYNPKGE